MLLIAFSGTYSGCMGVPFAFLKSAEIIRHGNLKNYGIRRFLSNYKKYSQTQQREGK
jgi:hypothetical protein